MSCPYIQKQKIEGRGLLCSHVFFTKKAEGRGQKAKGKKGKKNFSRGCYCPREKEKSWEKEAIIAS
jgi:hypothetical protein